MFDNLVINPHLVSSNYLIQFTFPKPFVIVEDTKRISWCEPFFCDRAASRSEAQWKQSRSLCDTTKASKTIIDEQSLQTRIPRSAGYSALTFNRPIRSSKNSAIFYSKLFREVIRGGAISDSQRRFDLDLFSQPWWSSGSKMPGVPLSTVRKEDSILIRSACALP